MKTPLILLLLFVLPLALGAAPPAPETDSEETKIQIDQGEDMEESGGWFSENVDFGGYLRSESAWHTGSGEDKDLVVERITWEEKIDITLGESGVVKGVFQAYYDFAIDLETSIYNDLEDPIRENLKDEDYRQGFKVKELHYDRYFEKFDLSLGRQYVVWGESDGLPILDIVNPRDYSEFVFKDFIDQRIPLDLLRLSYFSGDWSLTGVYIPDIEPEKHAEPGSEFSLSTNPAPTPQEIEDGAENAEYGFRLGGTLGDFDLSLVYLDVWGDNPTYFVYPDSNLGYVILPEYPDIKVYGGTFAAPFGDFLWRGELAYYEDTYFSSNDPAYISSGMAAQKDYLHYMLGFDLEVHENLNLTLQGLTRRILDFEDGLTEQGGRKVKLEDNKLTMNLSAKFMRELLRPSLLLIYDLEMHDYFAKLQAAYDLADAFTISSGLAVFNGNEEGFFGQFGEKDRFFVDFKYSF